MSGNNNQYFNLHINGFGFINRARLVTPKKGSPFYALTIAALRGDDGEKTYFDCKVVGKEAIQLCETHRLDQLSLGKEGTDKATLSFNLGDLYVDEFTYSADYRDPAKAGTKSYSLKARLLKINYLKVNDNVVVSSSADGQQQAA
jgi:hypothetical protein